MNNNDDVGGIYRIGKHLAFGSSSDIFEAIPVVANREGKGEDEESNEEFDFDLDGNDDGDGESKKEYTPPTHRRKESESSQFSSQKVIKIMKNPEHSILLFKEFDIMKSLSHPNILKPENIHYYEGVGLGMIVPRIRGGDMIRVLRKMQMDEFLNDRRRRYCKSDDFGKNGSSSSGEDDLFLRSICQCLVSAIAYLHANQVVHGDIKFDNLLIEWEGGSSSSSSSLPPPRVLLCDFGFASRQPPIAIDNHHIITHGSYAFVSAEIILGLPANPYAVDVWAMGVTMGCILTQNMLLGAGGLRGLQEHALFNLDQYRQFQTTHQSTVEREWWRTVVYETVPRFSQLSKRCRRVLGVCLRFNERRRATAKKIQKMKWIRKSVVSSPPPPT